MYKTQKYKFEAEKYEKILLKILKAIQTEEKWDKDRLRQIQAQHPKDGKHMFSKNDLLRGYKHLVKNNLLEPNKKIIKRIRMKPIRTQSGVTPVTVLTKPWPCPGKCIYCPNEPNMPKSYIESEPGAQRAAALNFDPYLQVQRRIQALKNIGHNTEKVELIVLGGSWSAYPKGYQVWFIKRCFEASNNPTEKKQSKKKNPEKKATLKELREQQKINETAKHKCVGLSLETRPDLITKEEVIHLRSLGCTKVQIGVQTLNNKLLKLNKRDHTVKQIKKAFELLRLAGFKIQAHWMVNLHGATPKKDVKDFKKLWSKDFQPDELKIYPTSVIENTKLHELFEAGKYTPYAEETLVNLVAELKKQVPKFCRITRVMRDIPSQEIAAGTKRSNLRQLVFNKLKKEGNSCKCIRCREIKNKEVTQEDLELQVQKYKTTISTEYFISFVTKKDEIAGFLRLSIPKRKYQKGHFIEELENSAIIREIHVYGQVVPIGKEMEGKAQHLGLGTKLLERAEEIAKVQGLKKLSVISAIGTREYYRKRGFELEKLYMSKNLPNQ
ncbi:tRNA uridine(34) 5-carboxymethylaminomethyl modification radical SAM/GNAT enzyme Elp3 [candidate division WWE3 bacterium]|nr:tRNA uridine(34) 5-carboxymethylaminomethyl modification radical SAM/GNAT enzyme Elp3 [candidate division WWE3 bacterium]